MESPTSIRNQQAKVGEAFERSHPTGLSIQKAYYAVLVDDIEHVPWLTCHNRFSEHDAPRSWPSNDQLPLDTPVVRH
jgi:hypothetical protein